MKLSRDVRARLFDGELPPITGSGICPAEAGKTYELSSCVSLTVLKVRHRKGGGWSLKYELHDRRDPVRLMRRTPGIAAGDFEEIRESFDEYGYPAEPTPDRLKEAAEESAYTSTPGPLADAGEAVDERTQRKFTKDAHRNKGQQGVVNELRRERYDMEQRLERVREDAEREGVDISSSLRVIERQLAKAEKRVYEGKAA